MKIRHQCMDLSFLKAACVLFCMLWLLTAPASANEAQAGDIEVVEASRDGHGMIASYQINGRVFMIHITPRKGTPYYLLDYDGDGHLETRQNDLSPARPIPPWVLGHWQ